MAVSKDNNYSLSEDIVVPKQWRYSILSKVPIGKGIDLEKIEITMKVALFSAEDIKLWLQSLEKETSCTYSVNRTGQCTGHRVLYKLFLNCHHNTRCKTQYNPSLKNRTKNTDCPSSLNITLQTIKKKFRGKPENAPDPEMPCIIVFRPVHNHNIVSADAFRFRCVNEETKSKLLDLYKLGHSPATALETIKIDLQLSSDNSEKLVADRTNCDNLIQPEDSQPIAEADFVMSTSEGNEQAIEPIVEEGRQLITEFSECVTRFMNMAPLETVPAIRKMVERTRKLKTVKALVSSCSTFASEET